MSVLLPQEEQLALADGVARYLADVFPLQRLRGGEPDSTHWSGLAELGLFGIALPEAEGGLGLGWMESALACREAGRCLLSPALVASVLGVRVAAAGGETQLRERLLRGERRVGLAMPLGDGQLQLLDAQDGLCLLLDGDALSLGEFATGEARDIPCIDDALFLQRIPAADLSGVKIEDAPLALGARLLLAAMLCGLLEQARDMAADYARSRVQFGRPIGAFQAVKHRCADAALGAELCWSQTLAAVSALESAAADAEFQVLSAKLLAGEEALRAARANIQIHGGMGFTDEVDAHRLLKRAHVLHQLPEDPRRAKTRLAGLTMEL